ncbi:hypothetical protein Tco_0700724 [Tanacetum coccineum]
MYIMTSRPRIRIPTRPSLGCDRFVSRAKVIENQSMATPVITISSDVSNEGVGSVVSRVILFGTIPTEVPIVPDIPTDLPSAPELPAVLPFLCSNDSESEPADELPERHVSLRLYDDVVSRWRDRRFQLSLPPPGPSIKIAIASPACDVSTLVITASSVVCRRIRMTTRKSTLGLRPISLEDHLHHSSKVILSPSGTLTRRRPQCSDYATPTSFSSAGPSRKRSWSSATSIPSTRGTSAMHLDESGDEGSLYMHTESDIDSDIQTDIKAETVAAATIVDGLDIKLVITGVEMVFEPGLAVIKSESELEEAEADDEADVEVQPQGTIKIGVDVTTLIDIPHELPMPDTIERLEQLEESVQERIVALDGSNTRLRDALDDNNNESGGNGNHGDNNGDGNQNWGNEGAIKNAPVARTISIDEVYEMPWKDLMKLLTEVYCPRNEIQKLENELWNLCVKGTDVVGYTR